MRRMLAAACAALVLSAPAPAAYAAAPAAAPALAAGRDAAPAVLRDDVDAAARLADVVAATADPFDRAIGLALVASAHQAAGARAPALPRHATPSAALAELAARHGVVPDPVALAGLDAQPAAVRSALTWLVDAFLAFDTAARSGEVPTMVAAREPLLLATAALHDALSTSAPTQQSTLDACPAVAVDLGFANDVYATDCALIVDNGGADRYLNNAGGGSLAATLPAAALVDLGPGADVYGGTGRSDGVNGGGSQGAGFLVDGGGDDRYSALDRGVNGGAFLGAGSLVDAGGNDHRAGAAFGVNGGGVQGAGLVVDAGGASDINDATRNGVNGGGNGGGGSGMLVDDGGPDTYTATHSGTNGGGSGGSGFLFDGSGADRYTTAGAATRGGNGGGYAAGAGLVVDLGGAADAYTSGSLGANGSGVDGAGLLLDGGGTGDSYADDELACNGSGNDVTLVPKCTGAQVDV